MEFFNFIFSTESLDVTVVIEDRFGLGLGMLPVGYSNSLARDGNRSRAAEISSLFRARCPDGSCHCS